MAALLSSRQCIAARPFTAAVMPANRAALRPVSVRVVAKLSKASEFRGLSNEEIDTQVQEAKKELFVLRIKYAKREVRRGPPGHMHPAAAAAGVMHVGH